MQLDVPGGRYVVAVSGGVDSVALLHLIRSLPHAKVTVAHFDHGIRPDSSEDRRHVQSLAETYGVPFVYHVGNLGPKASEATARQARYDFLHKVRETMAADAIITAHHQDDLLETAIINILRGTGRRGLTSLKSVDGMLRPLLHIPKAQLIKYAQGNNLAWREDSTNQNTHYLRNYVRHHILPRFSPEDRETFLGIINKLHDIDTHIERELINQLHVQPANNKLDRHWFTMLQHHVAREVMAAWLRNHGVRSYDAKSLERLVRAAKVLPAGKQVDVNRTYNLRVTRDNLVLTRN